MTVPPGRARRALTERRVRASGSAVERLLSRTTLSFHRRLIATVVIAVLVLGGISALLAWRQYDAARASALNGLEARVVAVSGILNTYFASELAALDAVARSPTVTAGRPAGMDLYFQRLEAGKTPLFSGAISWIDAQGRLMASNVREPELNLSQRVYVRAVLASGRPYISAGLIGLRTHEPLVVIAVPTFAGDGRLAGVIAGSVVLGRVRETSQALALGYGGLEVVDRNGRELLAGLKPVGDHSILARFKRSSSGVLSGSHSLEGGGDDAVAFARAPLADWTVTLERSRSSLFAAASNALLLELASLGAAIVVVLVLLILVVRRSRRDVAVNDARARSWSGLTSALAASATPAEVAEALLTALSDAFPDAVAIVALDDGDGRRLRARTRLAHGAGFVGQQPTLVEPLVELARTGPRSWSPEQAPALRALAAASGRTFGGLHGLPISGAESGVGAIALLGRSVALAEAEWALLVSFSDQAGLALERAGRFAHEHELALRLQRSLLPERLPSVAGVALSGHYHAGGPALEVGGDWYDALQRPDGLIQLCVGDVSGRGIGPATVMGRQRNIFHVCAFDSSSPAEIIRRMIRHTSSEQMVTVVCASLDPYAGTLTYASAGHPPALLVDRDTGEVVRLAGAGAPPIGIAEPAEIVEATVTLPASSVLAMYTDGLIERRGANIDDGIDLLGEVVASEDQPGPAEILARLTAAIGAPDDDVALLLAVLEPAHMPFTLELPALPASLAPMRERLRAWLERRGLDHEDAEELVLAASEAANNAIEHAYRGSGGTLRLRVGLEAGVLRIVVEDEGRWREAERSEERGRGLTLMRHLTDATEIERGANGTTVTLERRLRLSGDLALGRHGSSPVPSGAG